MALGKMQNENAFLSGFTDASDSSFEYIIQRRADRISTCWRTFISGVLRLRPRPFLRLPDPSVPLLLLSLMCFFGLQEAVTCQRCGGSGCAPCSLCHGSKLSMLANRFNESISDLRCQACYPHGLEECQSCSSKQHRLADSPAPQRGSQ